MKHTKMICRVISSSLFVSGSTQSQLKSWFDVWLCDKNLGQQKL